MQEIVVFDWETTSAKPESCRGVQFAALSSTEGGIINQIVNPEEEISQGASEVHGITSEMCQGQPEDYTVAAQFLELIERKGRPITAGHNSVTFDVPITNRLAKMGGSLYSLDGLHIDTMYLMQRLHPEAPSFRLSATEEEANKPGEIGLTQWLKLGDGSGAHDAFEDCKMVLGLIKYLCEKTQKDPQALAEWAATPFIHEVAGFGKHKGKLWGKGSGRVPYSYVKWCCDNWSSASLDMQATVLYHYNIPFKFEGALQNVHRTVEGCTFS